MNEIVSSVGLGRSTAGSTVTIYVNPLQEFALRHLNQREVIDALEAAKEALLSGDSTGASLEAAEALVRIVIHARGARQ